ncbi:MAG: hypothetical protein JNL50_08320 [Phycisphaerae bacterium]|nr:hypothetical protein [Phycisphaerae bacterium]
MKHRPFQFFTRAAAIAALALLGACQTFSVDMSEREMLRIAREEFPLGSDRAFVEEHARGLGLSPRHPDVPLVGEDASRVMFADIESKSLRPFSEVDYRGYLKFTFDADDRLEGIRAKRTIISP